jgi:hypothetical protein
MSWVITPGWSPADADAAAYITAVETADNQALENGVKVAIDNFVLGCKADGIWSAIKASCILAGARTRLGALTPLVGAAPTSFNFVDGDYNRKTGLVGNGSNKRLESNRNNNVDPQDSRHISVFATVVGSTGSFPAYMGAQGGGITGTTTLYVQTSNSTLNTQFTSATAQSLGASTTGFLGVGRSESSAFIGRTAGVSTSYSVASQAPSSTAIAIFATAGPFNHSNARLAFYSIGESLDLALLDARVTTLVNAFAAAIP